ncbi:hypothetical protein P3L10_033279 [Capsicum annuum]
MKGKPTIFLLSFLILIPQYLVISQPKIPYPPCETCSCTGNECQLPGDPYPYEWPDLVGVEIMQAKYIIERTNLRVTCVVLDSQCARMSDVCCNRVLLCPDENDCVKYPPKVG